MTTKTSIRPGGVSQAQKHSLLTLAVLAALFPAAARAADLGTLGGGTGASATGVSADGSVVVGTADDGSAGNAGRAFRWTQADGMISLGTLSGGYSLAWGVSADGTVVVGVSDDGNGGRAFRWTQAGGMTSLGTLNGGNDSLAYSVSSDGSVVVGAASDGSAANASRAFRWTQGGGMVSLGTLNGGNESVAKGVSADGSVVVGAASSSIANAYRAFRWTQAEGMRDLGTLSGGSESAASGVSADGSVVVGSSRDGNANNETRAFRWTEGGGMVSLGTVNGGTYSHAWGVSADGNVVVGEVDDGTLQAFRWTQSSGMQTVEAWLAENGVAVTGGIQTMRASAASADGSVVVGTLNNSRAFMARVTPFGSGMIDWGDFNRSLTGSAYIHVQSVSQAGLVLHGLHSTQAAALLPAGQRSVWVGGDWGRQERGSDNAELGSGEVGLAYGLTDEVTVKIAVGRTYSRQDTLHGGRSTLNGTYVLPELIAPLPGTSLRLGVSGYYNAGDADIQRGYLNAGTPVLSVGNPGVQTAGGRLRLDWYRALEVKAFALTPYTSVSYFRSRVDGYTETGGGFPVRWNERTEETTEARVGVDAVYALSEGTRLLGRLEAVHRLEGHSNRASGTILGLGNFEFAGMNYQRDWWRAGIGVESKVGPGVASVMINGTTENNGAAYWAFASYRVNF